jgi:glycosyltransferase involved in cell wall biosynthesis
MKIAVWHNLPSGGGKRALFDHVKGLTQRGHHVEAWCPPTADLGYLPLADLIREHVLSLEPAKPKPYPGEALKNLSRMKERLRAMDDHCRRCAEQINQGGFDLLFANTCTFFRVTPIARYVSVPSVLYLQEPYRELYEAMPNLVWAASPSSQSSGRSLRGMKRFVDDVVLTHERRIQVREERLNAAAFNAILVNSCFSRESVLRAYGLECEVCYLGVDVDKFHPPGGPSQGYVVGLGGLHFNKGVDRAIHALAEIPAARRPKLVWVGNFSDDAEERGVRQRAVACGVRFEFKLRISDLELVSLISEAALMIYTSRLEPFGFAPLEANACGTPVVAIAEGGIRETVKHQLNGLLVSGADPGELAQAIDRVLTDVALAQKLGRQGIEHVRSHWNLSGAIDRLEGHLRRVLSTGRNRSVLAVENESEFPRESVRLT